MRIVLPALVLAAVAIAGTVYWRVVRAMRDSEAAVRAEKNLEFTLRPFVPPANPGFEPVSSPAAFTRMAEFGGHLFIGGPTGLLEYDDGGKLKHEFHVGTDLPPSSVVSLARGVLADGHGPELLIATAGDGVLAYDGTKFRQILPHERDARSITSILPLSSGQLLVGTAKRGLLVYDGRHFGPFHASLSRVHVIELAGAESDFWIGTQDKGVAHWHGGATEWFDESSGLPDSRIFSIAVDGERAFAGTPAGIAEFERGRFVRVLAAGAFVRALLLRGDHLLAATMDDGLLDIPLRHAGRNFKRLELHAEPAEVAQLQASGDSVLALTATGVYVQAGKQGWKRLVEREAGLLTDRNVSALGVDPSGRIWVGYFDRGLDIIDADGRQSSHIEDDRVFCVNRIVPNIAKGATAVATANGLVFFDALGRRRQVLGRSEGLIADHVTDVAAYRDGLAIATPAGLTFLGADGARSLYAFHGLVNNHVYALGARGRQLLAGTLGGASLLEDEQIRATYTTATSALKHNWITAVVPTDEGWWIGTYGAGIEHMDSTGRIERAEGASDLIVNPNAMLVTERFILAGTMGRGLYVMERASGRWSAITDGLPSMNVTAFAAAQGQVYLGTDNGLLRISEERLAR